MINKLFNIKKPFQNYEYALKRLSNIYQRVHKVSHPIFSSYYPLHLTVNNSHQVTIQVQSLYLYGQVNDEVVHFYVNPKSSINNKILNIGNTKICQ